MKQTQPTLLNWPGETEDDWYDEDDDDSGLEDLPGISPPVTNK